MAHSLIPAGVTLAVVLALYAFYCHWEAGRVELAAAFRHGMRQVPTPPDAPSYRSRARWALAGCALVSTTAAVLAA